MADLCYITLDEAIEIHKLTVQHSGGGAIEHFDLADWTVRCKIFKTMIIIRVLSIK